MTGVQTCALPIFLDIAAGAGLGAFGAKYGVEELLAQKLAAREVAKKGMARRIIEAGAAEAPMEGLQAGQEQLASNLALQRQGFDVGTFAGVGGAAARDALVGALTAGTVGALPSRTTPRDLGATRDEIKETLRADLEARGDVFTEEQLDKATDSIMAARGQQTEKEAADESSGLDTGASEQGVSSTGESGVVSGATEGAAKSTSADLEGAPGATDVTGDREGTKSAALEPTAEEDIAEQKRLIRRRRDAERAVDRKSTRLNSSHIPLSRMPSSA